MSFGRTFLVLLGLSGLITTGFGLEAKVTEILLKYPLHETSKRLVEEEIKPAYDTPENFEQTYINIKNDRTTANDIILGDNCKEKTEKNNEREVIMETRRTQDAQSNYRRDNGKCPNNRFMQEGIRRTGHALTTNINRRVREQSEEARKGQYELLKNVRDETDSSSDEEYRTKRRGTETTEEARRVHKRRAEEMQEDRRENTRRRNIERIERRFADLISELKIEASDKTQNNRVRKTSEEIRRRKDEPSEEVRKGSENDRRTDEKSMKKRQGYGRRYHDEKNQGQFEARRVNDGLLEEEWKARNDEERWGYVEAENNRRDTRRKSNVVRNEIQFETYDNTRIIRRVAKTTKEARRLQDEPSEELRNTRKDTERRTDVEAENNRRETRRRSNDERNKRQVETYDSIGISRRAAKTNKEARRLQNEPTEELRSAVKTTERRKDVEGKNIRSGTRSDDERNERKFVLYDNTRIIRRAAKTRVEARSLKNEPSAELRNTRKESERRSDTETGMVRRETERRLNYETQETQERQLESFDSTRINRRETKTSKAGRINAIKESENVETRSIIIEPKRRSNDGAFGRELETFGNARIDRRMVETRGEANRLLEGTSEEFRNARKESERRSDIRNIRRETRRRVNDETPETQVKSFDNRRVAKISEDEPSEELRIARKERNLYMEARNNRREIRRRSNDETSGRDLETFEIKRVKRRVDDKSIKARTIQDEPRDEIRESRKDRRGSEEMSKAIDRIVQDSLSKQVRTIRRETDRRADKENKKVHIGLATKERVSNKEEKIRRNEKEKLQNEAIFNTRQMDLENHIFDEPTPMMSTVLHSLSLMITFGYLAGELRAGKC